MSYTLERQNDPSFVHPYIQELAAAMQKSDPIEHNSRYMNTLGQMIPQKTFKHQFITIALPTEKTDLRKLVRTICNIQYDYLKDSILSVENFSGELKKENLHIHILKHGIYSKTKIIRDMARKFKVAPNFINIKKGTTEQDYLNRLHYINGEKLDELKKENCLLDQEWRRQNDIEQIYYL